MWHDVEQCAMVWWNSVTVWWNGVERCGGTVWNSMVEECGTV